VQQLQINQAQQITKGGTHYGNMFNAQDSLIGPNDRSSIGGIVHRNSGQSMN
jgi:hypothetical protein